MERPNWVQAMSECTIDHAFRRIVVEIKKDLEDFAKASEKVPEEHALRFKIRLENAADFLIEEERSAVALSRRPHRVLVTIGRDEKVQIERNRQPHFTVENRWNEETAACELLVDGKVVEPWQISQKALGDLLFD